MQCEREVCGWCGQEVVNNACGCCRQEAVELAV